MLRNLHIFLEYENICRFIFIPCYFKFFPGLCVNNQHRPGHSLWMANFEAFHWNISSSINLFFLKSDYIWYRRKKYGCNSFLWRYTCILLCPQIERNIKWKTFRTFVLEWTLWNYLLLMLRKILKKNYNYT